MIRENCFICDPFIFASLYFIICIESSSSLYANITLLHDFEHSLHSAIRNGSEICFTTFLPFLYSFTDTFELIYEPKAVKLQLKLSIT